MEAQGRTSCRCHGDHHSHVPQPAARIPESLRSNRRRIRIGRGL